MVCSGQATQHDADHGEPEEGGDGSGVTLEVAGQAAVAVDPGEGALDDPALGQDASLRLTISNFHAPVLAMTLAIFGPPAFDKREGSPGRAQQVARTIAILHVGRVDGDAQQEPKIDQDVTLAAGDFLARIKALRVERSAPFEPPCRSGCR
jgi:hypothetical protein